MTYNTLGWNSEKSAPEGADNDDGEDCGPQVCSGQAADAFRARALTYVLAHSDRHNFFRQRHGPTPRLITITTQPGRNVKTKAWQVVS